MVVLRSAITSYTIPIKLVSAECLSPARESTGTRSSSVHLFGPRIIITPVLGMWHYQRDPRLKSRNYRSPTDRKRYLHVGVALNLRLLLQYRVSNRPGHNGKLAVDVYYFGNRAEPRT